MATRITQTDAPEQQLTHLRVKGDMLLDDAILIEKIATCLHSEKRNHVIVDLSELDFLDSDAASVLRRLGDLDGFEIEGGEVFLQSAVDMVERA